MQASKAAEETAELQLRSSEERHTEAESRIMNLQATQAHLESQLHGLREAAGNAAVIGEQLSTAQQSCAEQEGVIASLKQVRNFSNRTI